MNPVLKEIGEHLKKVAAEKGDPKLEQNLWTYVSQKSDQSGEKLRIFFERMGDGSHKSEPAGVKADGQAAVVNGVENGHKASPKKKKSPVDGEPSESTQNPEGSPVKKIKIADIRSFFSTKTEGSN